MLCGSAFGDDKVQTKNENVAFSPNLVFTNGKWWVHQIDQHVKQIKDINQKHFLYKTVALTLVPESRKRNTNFCLQWGFL